MDVGCQLRCPLISGWIRGSQISGTCILGNGCRPRRQSRHYLIRRVRCLAQRWRGLQEPWLGSTCDGFLGIKDTALLPMRYWVLREPLRPTGPLEAETWIGVHAPQQQFGHLLPCPALLPYREACCITLTRRGSEAKSIRAKYRQIDPGWRSRDELPRRSTWQICSNN